jgi:pimeloyl-ACP methyl ester carboxylesterase
MSQSGDATTRGRRPSCAACDSEGLTPQVSDLVLVIHGIGQKLSERVDSYHFTHAINSFRREFNVELSSENMKGNLKTTSGIMVLPVNWRLTVDLDTTSQDKSDPAKKYELANITPETLPAVRSIISDVMLDIPYYMSHHKDKMISAVIREANRVYRLWCRNNPGFQENGRVHLIGHSLGSVMAMEILSKQPTHVPVNLPLDKGEPGEKMFEFDTTNLFCCGSPAGFFLLLNGARLIPRKGKNKPGMEGEDHGGGVASEAAFGCLAVNNLYNIAHRNDPIAYLLNAAVDTDYAASLQPASVPSASTGLFASLWSTSKLDPYAIKGLTSRPNMQHMPSTVEMETHNFTQEEIAEKRMYLLNENGQIDYYLSSSGGPLEIQYLSMLSAHSSYWLSKDFVTFLVVEIGRKPGKANTVEVLRAVKRREWRRGDLG